MTNTEMKAKRAEKKARELVAGRTTEQLITDFELTNKSKDPYIYIVRGWLMDELEKRDAEAFDKWIDSYDDSPRKYYLG